MNNDTLLNLLVALNDDLPGNFSARLNVDDEGVTLRVEWRRPAYTGERSLIASQHRFKDADDYEARLVTVGTQIINDLMKYDKALA